MEAIKVLIWPRTEVQIDGQTVYHYNIIGHVMTDEKPSFQGKNEVLVMDSLLLPLTPMLESAKRYKPKYRLGNAAHVMASLGEMSPTNCEKDHRAD